MSCRLIKMNRLCIAIIILVLPSLQGCIQVEEESNTTIRLATTTSLRDSGLLDELLSDFSESSNIEVDVIAVGSGAAMSLAENDDVDVLIVHDPIREFEFIENGFAEAVETTDKPKRARNDKGQLVADDPNTPDVNEAWEGGEAPQ